MRERFACVYNYILRYDTNDDNGHVPRTIYGFLLGLVGSSFTPLIRVSKISSLFDQTGR